jgi:hypothetical protein
MTEVAQKIAEKELNEEELQGLIEKIAEDPSFIQTLSDAEISAISGRVSVFGIPKNVDEKKVYANLSIVNWRRPYLENILMTALIGYLHRLCHEFEPEEELEKIRTKFAGVLASNLTEEEREGIAKKRDDECKGVTKAARSVIARFLARHFNYNPDYHIRDATTTSTTDPERVAAQQKLEQILQTTSQQYGEVPNEPAPALAAWQAAKHAEAAIKTCARNATNLDDRLILEKSSRELTAQLARLEPQVAPARAAAAATPSPSADVFHHFRRYFDNHYEILQTLTQAYYGIKPDIEFSVKLYDTFTAAEAAKTHREVNNKTFTTDVITVESNCITLLGPYKENRERIEYYNQHTDILRELENHAKLDSELGRDLLKKQVHRKKAQNTREQGPESANLGKFISAASDAAGKGTRVLTKDEREKMTELQARIEDSAVPDGAIQMNVFRTEYSVDGEARLTRGKLYTQAEAPKQTEAPRAKKKKRIAAKPPK